MSAIKIRRFRWACPTVNSGHPAVLGSSRPHREDIVRYCLACSEATGRLVLRTAPVLLWKNTFRLLCEQAYGVRPVVVSRFIGEAAGKLRARDAAAGESEGVKR